MPNSDNQDGVHNKETRIFSKVGDDSTTFADVAAAQAYFLSPAALTVFDECATQLQWGLIGNSQLKVTYAFGTKGTGTAESDDWTAQFHSRKDALQKATAGPFNVSAISFDHSANDEATVTAAGHTFVAGDQVTFDSLGGFTGTKAEGNINEEECVIVASVDGNNFTTGPTENHDKSFTSGGTVSKYLSNWMNRGHTDEASDDHLF